MITTKTIKITAIEVFEHYVSVSENCTIAEARNILKNGEASVTPENEYLIKISYEK